MNVKLPKNEKKKILTFCTHERYQSNMDQIDAEFYILNYDGGKQWVKEYAEFPANHSLLPKNDIRPYISYDMVLSQSKYAQYEVAKRISGILKIPLVCLEHTLPTSNFTKEQIDGLKTMTGDYNIYISDFNRKMWCSNGIVIPHCVDTSIFSFNENHTQNSILTVQNDYINRNYCLGFDVYQHATAGLPTTPIGNTPGLSVAAKNTEELVSIYQENTVYLNTAHESPIPTSLLEAMACGCACVSIASCAIPEYITHGENGFLANSIDEMRYYLQLLLSDNSLCKKMGYKASETIKQKCNKNQFTENWNKILGEIQ